MKIIIAAAFAAATLVSIATSAEARPHRVCTVRHHHRVCHMVGR
jgi:hypothetical protein